MVVTHTRKKTDEITPDPRQPRRHYAEAETLQLGRSMQQLGQLQPVGVRPDGTLVWGERRWRAARLVGMPELDVVVTDGSLTEAGLLELQLTENIQRSDLTDGEKAEAFRELLRLNPDWTNKELAARLGLSEATVSKYLSPARCVPAVQEALANGRIGIAACYEISRAAAEQQPELLTQALAGTSRDELAAKVRKPRKSSSTPQARVRRLVCPLPSGVSVTLAGTDLSLDDGITALGEAVREMKRARELGYTAKTFTAAMRDKARKDTSAGAAD